MAVSPSTRDPRLIRYQIRRHGLKAVITKRYLTEECFRADERLEVAYRRFAELLLRWSRCVSACDLGCGRGFVLEFLAERRVEVAGIDGSPAVLPLLDPSIRSRVRILDLAVPQHLGKFDLAISTEVAEHLPRRTSRTFVQNIAQAATSKIAFSAAHPGQWGDGHINCRPQSFWISLFQDQGWQCDAAATEWFHTELERCAEVSEAAPWLLENLMLFVPARPASVFPT